MLQNNNQSWAQRSKGNWKQGLTQSATSIGGGVAAGLNNDYSTDTGNGFALVDGLISQGAKNKAGMSVVNAGAGIMNAGLSSNNPFLMLAGGIAGTLGTFINAGWGMKEDEELHQRINDDIYSLNTFQSNASDFDNIYSPQAVNLNTDVYTGGWFTKGKAARKNNMLRDELLEASSKADREVYNNIDTLRNEQISNLMGNYAALGGPLHSYGTEWTNGIREINTGNTHERNPLGGVPMGVAEDGQPNLVEEGEVIFNDYVFSNRLKVPKTVRDKYKLRGVEKMTFADAAKQAQKESEERPNDPISKRGLEDIMNKLTAAQEMLKEKRNKRQYAKGGKLFAKGGVTSSMNIDPYALDNYKLKTFDNIINYNYTDPLFVSSLPKPTIKPINEEQIRRQAKLNVESTSSKNNFNSNLRYAPAIGNAAMALRDMFVKPDYSNAKAIEDAANLAGTYTPVRFNTIGDYMKYTPMDRLFYANQLGAQAGATRRSILNNSRGNRGTAIAHLLAADYNAQNALGNLFRQADEADLKERQLVADFNRSTNLANSQGILQAAMANQNARQHALATRLGGIDSARKFREAIDSARGQSISTNLTTMFDNLGDIGRQEFTKAMIDNNRYLLYDTMGRYKEGMLDNLYKPKSKGGFLTIKSKRRR